MGYERELSTRQKALALSKRKDAIEAEMDAIYELLTDNGGPGIQGNLVDAEGFPRADIDVMAVRQQRNRFKVLKTDHKTMSIELDRLMQIALAPSSSNTVNTSTNDSNLTETPSQHATNSSVQEAETSPQTSEQKETSDSANASQATPAQSQPEDIRQPFALVDSVAPSSPSEAAGLVVNDRIIAFGAISLRSSPVPRDAMAALPGLLRSHENRPLDLIVRRGEGASSQVVTLSLTPRQWGGQGLLGCHVVPLEVSQVDPRYTPDVATAAALRSHTMSGHG